VVKLARFNTKFVHDEKQWFTEQRLLMLNQYDDRDQKKIINLEKNFGKICFTPLAVPIIKADDSEKFVRWYFENSKPAIKQNKDIANDYTGAPSFLSIDKMPEIQYTSKSIWTKNIINDFESQWPELWEQFYAYLPFEDIVGLSMWSSTRDIIPHRDPTSFLDIPLEFRILLHDPNPENNLFIHECLPNSDINNDTIQHAVPNNIDTNSFVWSNLRSQHTSRYNSKYKKIILIFHKTNKIDWNRYEMLLEKSCKTYQNYQLVSHHSIQDFINYES
jgi:hypothetical protein